MKNDSTEKITKKNRIKCSMLIPILLALILAAETYAWFFNKMDMATLMQVTPPSDITILGPGGSDMTALDLSYTADDKDANNKVTIKRVICIQSAAEKYQLEIVHTTNLEGLAFTLYPAASTTTGSDGTITENGYTYEYNSGNTVPGDYINLKEIESNYNYATDMYHDNNYPSYEGTYVQTHAEPLYWLASETLTANKREEDAVKIDGVQNYRTYYVCEISWTETKEKETDIFYILAKTADENQ